MMDNAVKERLVGAAVLVLLVVIVVPALLSGPRATPPPPAPADAAATVPAGTAGDLRVVEIDLTGAQGQPSAGSSPGAAEEPAAMPVPEATVEGATTPSAAAEAPAVPVEPPPSEPAAATDVLPAGAGWAVQVAALSSQEAAARLVAELREKNYPAFVLEHRADGRVLYRVRVGPEAQRERVDALAGRLQAEGFKTAVVAHP